MDNSGKIAGGLESEQLIEARLQLHYAVQFIAGVGASLAEPQSDFSHTSMQWHPDSQGDRFANRGLFVGSLIPATQPFQVALNPISFTSIILDPQGNPLTTFHLAEKTIAEVLNWHKQEIAKLGAEADRIELPVYGLKEFPDHAIAQGGTFDPGQETARQLLTSYYANTQQLLLKITAQFPGASGIRIWPHHFDIATLIDLPHTQNGEPVVGIGMSPGDTNYSDPYWYLYTYPALELDNLPELDGSGFWHKENWIGAVLRASQLSGEGEKQEQQIEAFLNSALKIAIAKVSP
jgi:hypothetical protein